MNRSRRAFLGTGMAALAAAHAPRATAAEAKTTFVDIIRPPEFAAAYVEGTGRIPLSYSAGRWQAQDVELTDRGEAVRQGKRPCYFAGSAPQPA